MSGENAAVDTTGQANPGSSETTEQSTEESTQETPSAGIMEAASEGEESTTDAPADAAKVVPESYTDFTNPEGYEPMKEAVDGFKALAKKLGLTQTQAQEIYGNYASTEIAQSAEAVKAAEQAEKMMVDGWVKEAKNHPEFGGANFEGCTKLANRVAEKFGNAEFTKLITDSKIANNPHFYAFLNNIAKVISDDTFVKGDSTPATDQKFENYTDMLPQPGLDAKGAKGANR